MATNGGRNDPMVEQLENTLRGVNTNAALQAAQPVAAGGAAVDEQRPIYDLAAHASGTAKSLRDLADYSNNVANDIERIVGTYITHMHRLMGKIGK